MGRVLPHHRPPTSCINGPLSPRGPCATAQSAQLICTPLFRVIRERQHIQEDEGLELTLQGAPKVYNSKVGIVMYCCT